MANATIKIDGVGFSTTVEVTDEETILDALKRANIDIAEDGGQERQVTATPKRANLG
jgi:ferredoxin